MKKSICILLAVFVLIGLVMTSCNNDVQPVEEELVYVSFGEMTSRTLTATLETFDAKEYYWSYEAKKNDGSGLKSGETAAWNEDGDGSVQVQAGKGLNSVVNNVSAPTKVPGFSKGYWDFRLFAYKDSDRTVLAYWGEADGVLIDSDHHLASVIVSPTTTGDGYLKIGTITFNPASASSVPTDLVIYTDEVRKLEGTEWVIVPTQPVEGIYTLHARQYKFTRTYSYLGIPVASGSVIVTVYSNLTTTISGSLSELTSYAQFAADQNPDAVNVSAEATGITYDDSTATAGYVLETPSTAEKAVTAAITKNSVDKIMESIQESDSAIDLSASTTNMTLALGVDTTGATETTIEYEINMTATINYKETVGTETVSRTTVADVKNVADYVTAVIPMQTGLDQVTVKHSGLTMKSIDNPAVYDPNQDTHAEVDGVDIWAGFYNYNKNTGVLTIVTRSFSPFTLSYVVPSYVAAIGTEKYTTLVDAVDALKDGDTLTLLADLDFSKEPYSAYKWAGEVYNPLVIPKNNITIDLNGKTIENMGNCAISLGNRFAVDGRISNVTIKNGTLKAGKTDNVTNSYVLLIGGADGALVENVTTEGGINVCTTSEKVVIKNSNVTGTKYYTVCAQGGSDVIIKGTTYTKNTDSTVETKAMFWIEKAGSDSDLETPENPTYAYSASSITIESGTFTIDTENGGVFFLSSGLAPVIKGGTYTINPSAYVAEGYKVVEGSGVWSVVPVTEDDEVYVAGSSYPGPRYMTFAQFRDSVNAGTDYAGCTVKLQKSIDLTNVAWTPIGTTEYPFNGFFDGQGYTISNLYFNGAPTGQMLGLFGEVKGTQNSEAMTLSGVWNDNSKSINEDSFGQSQYSAGVMNLVLSGFDITNTSSSGSTRYTGALAGRMDDAYIEDITVANSTIKGTKGVGGLVGSFNGSTAKDCQTQSDVSVSAITGGYNVGGLFGGTNYSNHGTQTNYGAIIGCTNNASVTIPGDGSTGGYIGGIVGLSQNWIAPNSTNSSGFFLVNCINRGAIEAKTTTVSGICGIAGYGQNVHAFVGCENEGILKANTVSDGVAGISYGGSSIYNSSNSGSISAYAAKMAGVFIENKDQTIGFAFGCSNTGTLSNSNTSGAIAQIAIVGGILTAEDRQFATVSDVYSFICENDCKSINFINCTVADKTGELNLSSISVSIYSDTQLCTTVKVSDGNVALNIPSVSVVVPSGASSTLAISSMGAGCSVTVETGATIQNVTIGGDGSTLTVNGFVSGNLIFAGEGAVSGTISSGATVGHVGFGGTGTYTLTNEGTISHTHSEGNPSANEHTVSTIKACTITINNKGLIAARANTSGRCSYAMLFYNECDVIVNQYPGSSIVADVNGYLLACGSAHSVVYNTCDANGEVTETVVKK